MKTIKTKVKVTITKCGNGNRVHWTIDAPGRRISGGKYLPAKR